MAGEARRDLDTFEERVWAGAFYIELHQDANWNPWRKEEEAAELERAHAVMDEWERAEPDFKAMTDEELKAKFARQDRDWDQWREEYAKRLETNKQRYDPEREQARLELLEVQSWLRHEVAGIAKVRSGEAYPKMDPQRQAQQITELDERIRRHQASVDRLSPIVGDPEDVVDQHGLLPSDRRPTMHYYYREWRVQKVQRLCAEIAEADAGMASAEDKAERSRLGIQRQITKCQLEEWLAVPRMQAEDMCADCMTPAAYHEQGGPFTGGPCSAWPENAEKRREVREMLKHTAQSSADASPQPSTPKPQPLAVVPSGLPIAEVVKQLQKLQKQYPDAEVRRGRANRWELWQTEGQNSGDPGAAVNDRAHLAYPSRRTLAWRAASVMAGPSTTGSNFAFWEAGGTHNRGKRADQRISTGRSPVTTARCAAREQQVVVMVA